MPTSAPDTLYLNLLARAAEAETEDQELDALGDALAFAELMAGCAETVASDELERVAA